MGDVMGEPEAYERRVSRLEDQVRTLMQAVAQHETKIEEAEKRERTFYAQIIAPLQTEIGALRMDVAALRADLARQRERLALIVGAAGVLSGLVGGAGGAAIGALFGV